MALSDIRIWLIAYDIREPRRLARVHRYLKRYAVPLQYSVFITRASIAQIGNLRAGIARIINAKTDDVRIYHIPERTEVHTFGSMMLPDDVALFLGDSQPRALPFTSR